MLSLHQVEPNPQFISTDRHIMQGYIDLGRHPQWNGTQGSLSGSANVIGGETFRIILANNGFRPLGAVAEGAKIHVESRPGDGDLVVLSIDTAHNAQVTWSVRFERN